MIQPRNTLVVLKVIEKAERKVGQITVPTHNDLYTEAEVVAVGPGSISAAGGQPETFDLKKGQRVWVKYKRHERGPMGPVLGFEGISYREGDTDFLLVEQSGIVGILAESVDPMNGTAFQGATSLN